MATKTTVLVIEDAALMRECLCASLMSNGFEVSSCADGYAALTVAARIDFELIITDYSMPDMNGAEVIRRFRAQFPASFIIGVSLDDRKKEFIEAGANAFLQKPYEYDELLNLIQEITRTPPCP